MPPLSKDGDRRSKEMSVLLPTQAQEHLHLGYGTRPNTHFTFKDVVYTVLTPQGALTVLHGVSASLPVGELMGVMGPSGAGKTSLLDVLIGRHAGTVTGLVPADTRIEYVTQEMTLLTHETGREVMNFFADLTLPRSTTLRQKRLLIDDLMEQMGLTHVMSTKVGGFDVVGCQNFSDGMSGGERKRLQVASHLLRQPQSIILDEPTTGLDAKATLELVDNVKRACVHRRLTALASLHQPRPEVFAALDRVLLMAAGRVLFVGGPGEMLPALAHFTGPKALQETPCDFVMDSVAALTTNQLLQAAEAWRQQEGEMNTESTVDAALKPPAEGMMYAAKGPTSWERTKILCRRQYRALFNSSSLLFAGTRAVGQFVAIGINLCICLQVDKGEEGDVPKFATMIFVLIFSTYTATINSAMVPMLSVRTAWYVERPQRVYDVHNAYGAMMLPELSWAWMWLGSTYVVFWLVIGWGYQDPNAFWESFLVMQLGAHAAWFMFVFVCGWASSIATMLPLIMITMQATGAMSVQQNYMDIPMLVRGVYYITPWFWMKAGLLKQEWGAYAIDCDDGTQNCFQGDDILQQYSYDLISMFHVYCALIGLVAMYSILAALPFYFLKHDATSVMQSPVGLSSLFKLVAGSGPAKEEEAPSLQAAARIPPNPRGGQALHFSHLYYHVITVNGDRKEVLHGINFKVESNRMVAIMGPSGAGKTSLLRIMGALPVSGEVAAKHMTRLHPSHFSFVVQEDVLPVMHTVQEALEFYAACLVEGGPAAAKESVQLAVRSVGLERVRHSLIGGMLVSGISLRGISGGQRRRVSIGIAMLKDPRVMFLDEPTSGLDASVAHDIASWLRELTRARRTVVATIHQPRLSIFMCMDVVVFMASGEILYCGPPDQAAFAMTQATGKSLPESCNPADFVLDCLGGATHDEVLQMMQKIPQEAAAEAPAQAGEEPVAEVDYEVGVWSFGEHSSAVEMQALQEPASVSSWSFTGEAQAAPARELPFITFKRLLSITRNILVEYSHSPVILVRLMAYMTVVLVMAIIFSGIDNSTLYASEMYEKRMATLLTLSFMGIAQCALSVWIFSNRGLWFHDLELGNYSAGDLLGALFLVEVLVGSVIESALVYNIFFGVVGERSGMNHVCFGVFNAALLMATLKTFALNLGFQAPDLVVGLMGVVAVVDILYPTSGTLQTPDDIVWPFKLLVYVNPIHYAVSNEMLNQLEGRDVYQDDFANATAPYAKVSSREFLKEYEYNSATGVKGQNIVIMLCIWTIAVCTTYLGLRSKILSATTKG